MGVSSPLNASKIREGFFVFFFFFPLFGEKKKRVKLQSKLSIFIKMIFISSHMLKLNATVFPISPHLQIQLYTPQHAVARNDKRIGKNKIK